MRRLSGLDAAMLYAETPAMHMHGATMTILDPSTAPQPFDVDRFRQIVAGRLDRLAPFRQRLVAPPLGVDRPVWVDDPHFDLHAHIRGIAVPRPGTRRQVAELLGQLLAVPLPHDRPLWQMWVVEGLEGGLVGLFGKVHHALLGGVRATAMFELLYDLDPDLLPAPGTPDVTSSERAPSTLAVAGHAALGLAATPLRLARLATEGARAGARVARFLASEESADAVLPWDGPRTSLNGSLEPARACAYTALSFTDVQAVKHALGVTVNDVALAVCGGALRRYLHDRGELTERSLTAAAPVSVAGADGGGASVLGNTLSVFGATLGTDVADPVARVGRVAASTRAAKHLRRAIGDDILLDMAAAVPPGAIRAGARALSSWKVGARIPPPFNLIVSNLPGPPVALYSGGARALGFHVFGPLVESVSANITVVSYQDSLDVGIVAVPRLVEDPWPIADAMPGALAELRSAVAILA